VCIGNWCPHNFSGGFSGAVTLTQAITRSINVIPVKLSIALGNGNPKAGRALIRQTARAAGLRTPLPDTPSMPIGADEVTVLDHTGGYTMFPNGGMSATPHAILEVRTGPGELIFRWDRDGKKPTRVLPVQVATDMNQMMNHVVEEGTAKRAALDGIQAAGKTGTTNAFRDAWFMGFTGNYVCGIWFGNDDYTPTNRMTGGSLPAQTWHDIMTYAHQGIELKQIPGLPAPTGPKETVANAGGSGTNTAQRAPTLTRRGIDILVGLERMMDDATKALADRGAPGQRAETSGQRPGTIASADGQSTPVRGN
jgi:penicillin-binding protein 1A